MRFWCGVWLNWIGLDWIALGLVVVGSQQNPEQHSCPNINQLSINDFDSLFSGWVRKNFPRGIFPFLAQFRQTDGQTDRQTDMKMREEDSRKKEEQMYSQYIFTLCLWKRKKRRQVESTLLNSQLDKSACIYHLIRSDTHPVYKTFSPPFFLYFFHLPLTSSSFPFQTEKLKGQKKEACQSWWNGVRCTRILRNTSRYLPHKTQGKEAQPYSNWLNTQHTFQLSLFSRIFLYIDTWSGKHSRRSKRLFLQFENTIIIF